jgi:glucose/arabinose dehydrogenase
MSRKSNLVEIGAASQTIRIQNQSTYDQSEKMTELGVISRVLAVGLIAFVVAACSSTTKSGQSAAGSSVTSTPVANLTISLSSASARSVTPVISPSPGGNVALQASGLAYIRGDEGHLVADEAAYLAIDGDLETIWSSKQPAPQWYSVVLDQPYLVDRVEMIVTQAPPGQTTHEVWLGHGSGLRTFYKRLSDVHTEDGQILSVDIEPPQIVNEVLILTIHSPSWVAWRELRVFGRQPVISEPEEEAPQYEVERVASGLEYPVFVTHAGDGSGRIFVVEQRGRIRIIKDGVMSDSPFLDISERVSCCEGEKGLLGLAFPPTYSESRHFYVSYSAGAGDTTISRFATTEDPDRADEESEEILLAIDQPHVNHNGGHLAFGPQDGYLYIGSGDGGLPRDPENRGQASDTLLGKLLRIDVESGVAPYGIPAGNPFVQNDQYRAEIWALGLRNPWGFAFDRQTGDLYLPDTGNFKREEVNYQPAESRGGENYGWPIMEGDICFEHDLLTCSADGLILPVAQYDHTRGCAVVGGAVFRGDEYPGLQGFFIVADYCTGHIYGVKRSDGGETPDDKTSWRSALLAQAGMPISSVGADEEGNVYFTGHAEKDGVVYVLADK